MRNRVTPRELFRAVLKRQIPERIPAFPIPGAISPKLVGKPLGKYLSFGKAAAEILLDAHKLYEPDIIGVYGDETLVPEALGCKIEFFVDKPPEIREPLIKKLPRDVSDIVFPNPYKDGRLPVYLETVAMVSREISETVPVGSGGSGPFTMCGKIRGVKQLLLDIASHPDLVHELLDKATDFVIEWGRAMHASGAGLIIAEASAGLLSPKHFNDFVFPYLRKVYAKWRKERIFAGLHICGDTRHILESMAETGATNLSIDHHVDIGEAKKLVGKKVVLTGNVNQIEVVYEGIPSQIEQACRECIRKAGSGGMYVLSTGCEVPLGTSLENLRAFMKAAKKYGKYPLEV